MISEQTVVDLRAGPQPHDQQETRVGALGAPHPARVVAVVQAVLGLIALGWAIWPYAPSSPTLLDATVGLLLLLMTGFTFVAGPRLSPWSVDVLILLTALANLTLVGTRGSDQGAVVLSLPLMALAVAAALYLPKGRLVAVMSCLLVGYLLAVLLNNSGVAMFWYLAAVILLSIALVPVLVYRLVAAQRALLAELNEAAVRDPLTGVLNRRGLVPAAAAAHSVADRSGGAPTTVALLDMDHFKEVNDAYGHATGDRLLQETVAHWRNELRAGDVLARLGGDEFLMVLPHTRRPQAEALLERIRLGSELSWTFGLAEWHREEELPTAIRRADRRLYRAKAARPDRAERLPEDPPGP